MGARLTLSAVSEETAPCRDADGEKSSAEPLRALAAAVMTVTRWSLQPLRATCLIHTCVRTAVRTAV
jgi:hypothetical protein